MAATNGALSGSQSLSGSWLTVAQQNQVVGGVVSPVYPGPVSENHENAGVVNPGKSGPPEGPPGPDIPATGQPQVLDLSGGEILDQVADLGHSAPIAPTFSQTEPFAPPGPIQDTHGYDTGGTQRKEHVPVPRSPGWFRRVLTGQTFNRQAQVTDDKGWQVNTPNGRVNFDQTQGQNANGYDPFTIPYSERPIRANFAQEAYPVDGISSVYGVDGQLPDLAGQGGQGNLGYTSPPDPSVVLTTEPAGTPGPWSGAAPDIGMEYVSG
jgi:hypothetical protein